MNALEFASRYAKALYAAAAEQGKTAEVKADLERIAFLMETEPQIRSFCSAVKPGSRDAGRFTEIAFIPYVGQLTGNMLGTAVRNGRVGMLPFLKEAFENILSEEGGEQIVILETARPAVPELSSSVRDAMEQKLGSSVILREMLNPGLVGGFRLRWDGRMIDASVAGRLNRLKRYLHIV